MIKIARNRNKHSHVISQAMSNKHNFYRMNPLTNHTAEPCSDSAQVKSREKSQFISRVIKANLVRWGQNSDLVEGKRLEIQETKSLLHIRYVRSFNLYCISYTSHNLFFGDYYNSQWNLFLSSWNKFFQGPKWRKELDLLMIFCFIPSLFQAYNSYFRRYQ